MRHAVKVNRETVRLLHMQALESYPFEVEGQLIGTEAPGETVISLVATVTHYKHRSRGSLLTDMDQDMWDEKDWLGPTDLTHIGGWHSHPDSEPVMSMPNDVTQADKRRGIHSDFEELEDGQIEWIVGLFPGTRRKIIYHDRAYIKSEGRRYRCQIHVT